MQDDDNKADFDGPESLSALIDAMTPEVYERLRTAVELGKWPDGNRVSAEQLEYSLQAIILYEARHVPEEQRTGVQTSKECASQPGADEQILRILDDESTRH